MGGGGSSQLAEEKGLPQWTQHEISLWQLFCAKLNGPGNAAVVASHTLIIAAAHAAQNQNCFVAQPGTDTKIFAVVVAQKHISSGYTN